MEPLDPAWPVPVCSGALYAQQDEWLSDDVAQQLLSRLCYQLELGLWRPVDGVNRLLWRELAR